MSALAARAAPIGILAVAVTIVGWLLGVIGASALDDVVYADGEWSGTEDLAATLVPAALGFTLVSFLLYMVACHQLYHARLGLQPSLLASVRATMRRLPVAILWSVVVLLGLAAALLAGGLLASAVPLLGVFGVFGVLFFAAVKLAFLMPALAIPVEGRNPISASAEVSEERFWAVLGRLMLLVVILFAISMVTQGIASAVSSNGSDVEQYFKVDDDELVFVDVGSLVNELNLTSPLGIVLSIPGAFAGLVWLSGVSVLFAETHQVRPSGPAAGPGHGGLG